MGFTLFQLLVLARILPLARYSEIVFLATVGFYLQPIDQAIGRSNFIALQNSHPHAEDRYRSEIRAVIALHGGLVLAVSLIVPSILHAVASPMWIEDVLFLFLGLAINLWAFDLQSTAWAIGRNLPFVQLSILHRLIHLSALALAFATGRFAFFVGISSIATMLALLVVFGMFAKAGLLRHDPRAEDWTNYRRVLRLSFLATITDFLTLNAPYALVAARFGIGPSLVAFDSVMKVARIMMAAARTLAEIVLPRHSALVAGGRLANARSMFRKVLGASLGLALIPFLAISTAGGALFHLLLGRNDVVPLSAMPAAALIVLASGLYQPASFFLSFSDRKRSILALSLGATVAIASFGALLISAPATSGWLLSSFATVFVGLAAAAAWLTDQSFKRPTVLVEPAVLVNESV